MKVHLTPTLGSLPVTTLRPEHIQHYYTEALASGRRDGKGGLSGLTVRKHHTILHKALGFGLKHGMLTRNPCDGVDLPRGRSKKLTIRVSDFMICDISMPQFCYNKMFILQLSKSAWATAL